MKMPKKEKHETLKEFAERVPLHTWSEIPLAALTKEEFLSIKGSSNLERMRYLARDGSARDLVIQMSGHLESKVRDVLHANSEPRIADDLFGSRKGKIRDHSLRIDLAESLRLVSHDDAKQLRILAKIRNQFGHDPDLYLFDHDEQVVSWTKSLHFNVVGKAPDLTLRERYFYSSYSLLSRFENGQIGYGKSTKRRADYSWRWCDEHALPRP